MMRYSGLNNSQGIMRTATPTPTPQKDIFAQTQAQAAALQQKALSNTQPGGTPVQSSAAEPKQPEPQEIFVSNLNNPGKPVSKVPEKDIKIPEFLRRK